MQKNDMFLFCIFDGFICRYDTDEIEIYSRTRTEPRDYAGYLFENTDVSHSIPVISIQSPPSGL